MAKKANCKNCNHLKENNCRRFPKHEKIANIEENTCGEFFLRVNSIESNDKTSN